MSREVVETCDVCRRVVSDPLKDKNDYIVAKRWKWSFSSARWWHRIKDDDFIVCDFCLDDVRALAAPRPEGGNVSDYDSRPETQAHIYRVGEIMGIAIYNLDGRAAHHDASKLVSPEVEAFDIATPKLAQLVYGSPEYKQSTDDLGPALEHHYENNDHHPQHFPNGVQGMSLMALIEMLCDWRAASERSKQRTDDPEKVKTFADGLAYQQERFGYSDEVAEILRNTVKELGL